MTSGRVNNPLVLLWTTAVGGTTLEPPAARGVQVVLREEDVETSDARASRPPRGTSPAVRTRNDNTDGGQPKVSLTPGGDREDPPGWVAPPSLDPGLSIRTRVDRDHRVAGGYSPMTSSGSTCSCRP